MGTGTEDLYRQPLKMLHVVTLLIGLMVTVYIADDRSRLHFRSATPLSPLPGNLLCTSWTSQACIAR